MEEPKKSIVCITYTNNAVAEIRSRIINDNLRVSTIHDFIWHVIENFQKEIKECLVELINDDEQILFVAPKEVLGEELISLDYFDGVRVEYTEWYSMNIIEQNKVQISHDHVLIVAEKMFSKYKKLSDI